MPLRKSPSKSAFEHNVKAEMESGKPQKQALAIAYATKRKARKMAQGGMVRDESIDDSFLSAEDGSESPFQDTAAESDSEELQESGFEPEPQMDNEEGNSLLENVMRSVRKKHRRG